MAKKDGEVIAIRFSDAITTEPAGNEAAFTVTMQEYTYQPGGTLYSAARPVHAVAGYMAIDEEILISSGELDHTVENDGVLMLEDLDG